MRVFYHKMLSAFDFYHLHSDFLLLTIIPITIPQPAMTRSMHSSLGSAGNMIVTKMRGRFSDSSMNSSNSSGNSSNNSNSNKLSSLGWVTVYFNVQYSEQSTVKILPDLHSNGLSLLVVCDLHSHPPLQQRRLHLSCVPCKPSGHDTPSLISLSMRYSLSQL